MNYYLDPGSTLSEKFLWYDQRCQSDSIRQIKGIKMLSIAVCPITQKHIGKIILNFLTRYLHYR